MSSFRFLCTVAFFVPALFFAEATAKAAGTLTIKLPPPIDTRILIKSVDAKSGTITVRYMRDAGQPSRTYIIDGGTVLTVSNVTGTINQIRVGMQVRSYVERDDVALDSIDLGIADPAPVVPKKSSLAEQIQSASTSSSQILRTMSGPS